MGVLSRKRGLSLENRPGVNGDVVVIVIIVPVRGEGLSLMGESGASPLPTFLRVEQPSIFNALRGVVGDGKRFSGKRMK